MSGVRDEHGVSIVDEIHNIKHTEHFTARIQSEVVQSVITRLSAVAISFFCSSNSDPGDTHTGTYTHGRSMSRSGSPWVRSDTKRPGDYKSVSKSKAMKVHEEIRREMGENESMEMRNRPGIVVTTDRMMHRITISLEAIMSPREWALNVC